ncbi:TPA: DUF3486 family protein [Vibrio parahaemolyticus]|nr:DUF3486 family protein [Vibrio parahaemolyticus]
MPPRKKLDLTGHVERVVTMFNEEKMTCRDIAATLQKEGLSVSHSTVARTVKDHNQQLAEMRERIRQQNAMAKAMHEEMGSSGLSGLELAEMCIAKLRPHILKSLEEMEHSENHFKNTEKLVNALESLTRSQATISKTKYSLEKVFDDVKGMFETSIVELLGDEHPEVLQVIFNEVQKIRLEDARRLVKDKH